MRKLLVLSGALGVAVVPAAALAQFSFGARVGFAPAMGDALKDPTTGKPEKLSDGIRSQVPLQIDAAYRLSKEWALGAYFSYGVGQNGTGLQGDCSAIGANCSSSDVRLGLQVFYSFSQVSPSLVPWAGAGIGYEWTTIEQTGGGSPDVTGTLSGWELLNLQIGADFVIQPQFAFGPFVMISIAQYSNSEARIGGQTVSQSISNKAMHEWLGFGIRGRFDL